ncbi:hypothetical protein EV401DRAFT_2008571, partial [Pisolithus croceorrhizus]
GWSFRYGTSYLVSSRRQLTPTTKNKGGECCREGYIVTSTCVAHRSSDGAQVVKALLPPTCCALPRCPFHSSVAYGLLQAGLRGGYPLTSTLDRSSQALNRRHFYPGSPMRWSFFRSCPLLPSIPLLAVLPQQRPALINSDSENAFSIRCIGRFSLCDASRSDCPALSRSRTCSLRLREKRIPSPASFVVYGVHIVGLRPRPYTACVMLVYVSVMRVAQR